MSDEQEFTEEQAKALVDDMTGARPIEGDGFFYDEVGRAVARAEARQEEES
jgi:hypothetical protein